MRDISIPISPKVERLMKWAIPALLLVLLLVAGGRFTVKAFGAGFLKKADSEPAGVWLTQEQHQLLLDLAERGYEEPEVNVEPVSLSNETAVAQVTPEELDRLSQDNKALVAEMEKLIGENTQLMEDKESLAQENNRLRQENDQLKLEKAQLEEDLGIAEEAFRAQQEALSKDYVVVVRVIRKGPLGEESIRQKLHVTAEEFRQYQVGDILPKNHPDLDTADQKNWEAVVVETYVRDLTAE